MKAPSRGCGTSSELPCGAPRVCDISFGLVRLGSASYCHVPCVLDANMITAEREPRGSLAPTKMPALAEPRWPLPGERAPYNNGKDQEMGQLGDAHCGKKCPS